MDWRRYMKSQFHYSKFSLSHRDWRLFVYTPWLPRNSYQIIYIAYRWIVCLYFLVWLAYAGYQADINHGPKFLIFVTSWEFVLFNVYLLLAAVVVTYKIVKELYVMLQTPMELKQKDLLDEPFLRCHCCCKHWSVPRGSSPNSSPSISWYIQTLWVLYTLVSQTSLPVVILYWAFSLNLANWQVSLHEHLFIVVPVGIDLFVTGYPLRLYHFVYSSLLAIVYFVFTLFYYAAGGTSSDGDTSIYPVLDYGGSPAIALGFIVLMCTFIPFVLNTAFWALGTLRTFVIYKKLQSKANKESLYSRELSTGSTMGLVVKTDESFTMNDDGTVVSTVIVDTA